MSCLASALNRNKFLLFWFFLLSFLREGNYKNTIIIFRMNILMLYIFTYIEASGALSGITFSVDKFTIIILLIFILSSCSLNVKITILQLDLYILFMKSRKLNTQLVISINFLNISLANCVQPSTPITQVTDQTDGPKTATNTRISTIDGKDMKISAIRIIIASAFPLA